MDILRAKFSPLADHRNLFDPWSNEDLPPITLKNLSDNLTFLEKQFRIKAKSHSKRFDRLKKNYSSFSSPKSEDKENQSSLPYLTQHKQALHATST